MRTEVLKAFFKFFAGGLEDKVRVEKNRLSSSRYGFNGQEKDDEVAGAGNSNTAMYWQYDTRLGRRWNVDPIYNTDISRYAVNGNNPIYYLDPNGDFRTKAGANVYKFFNGGTVTKSLEGKGNKKYYVEQKGGGKGRKGRGRLEDGSYELDEVEISVKLRYGWGDGNPANVVDDAVYKVNKAVNYVENNASDAWNSPLARKIILDYYTFSGSFQTSSVIYMNEDLNFTLLLRGKDPGLYFNTTTGFGAVSSVGVDVGCSVGKGYYNGDARHLSSKMLGGWQASGTVGVGIKAIAGGSVYGGVDVGFNDDGKVSTITNKVGINLGVGVSTPVLQGSIGVGKSTNAIPIFKF